jgi:TRAP-type mannitol/chloroaromatic compound transport system permease large subunit
MTPEILSIIMFFTTLGLLLFGFPVAFTLAGSALIFGFIGEAMEIFQFPYDWFFSSKSFWNYDQ